jgi:hypothetical protein
MPKMLPRSISILLILALTSACPAEDILLDGTFDDWSEIPVSATDPLGDATGAFDFTRIHAHVVGQQLFIRLDTQQPLNLQSGPDEHGTLQLLPKRTGSGHRYRARRETRELFSTA